MDILQFLASNSKKIDAEMEKLLPKKLSTEWAESVIGKPQTTYDAKTLTDAISKPFWELVTRGGKRWRPNLTLLCYEVFNKNQDEILSFSVFSEFLHVGSLIIDDVEDSAPLRRGKPAIHKIFGEDIAINAGNTLYFIPLSAICNSSLSPEKKTQIYDLYYQTMAKLHLGQAMDIYWHRGKKANITEDEYLQMCFLKTGALAEFSAKLGAILADASQEQIEKLGNFAATVGVAFQIQDDILNLFPQKGWGKETGDDIIEGKRSILVINTLQNAKPVDRKKLLKILDAKSKTKKMIKQAISIIAKYNSKDYAASKAKQVVESAWQEIVPLLPENDAKQHLRAFADFLIERKI